MGVSAILSLPSISRPLPTAAFLNNPTRQPFSQTRLISLGRHGRRGLVALAEGNGGGRKQDALREGGGASSGNGEGELRSGRRRGPALLGFRWRDLLDPEPENIVAVGLTGLLAWASVQALWQIFFISGAILLAALKYSFIAALLLLIVITLL